MTNCRFWFFSHLFFFSQINYNVSTNLGCDLFCLFAFRPAFCFRFDAFCVFGFTPFKLVSESLNFFEFFFCSFSSLA